MRTAALQNQPNQLAYARLRFTPARKKHAVGPARLILLLFAIAPLGSVVLTDSYVPFSTRCVGWLLWVLCFLPAWMYVGDAPSDRRPIPFVPLIGLLFLFYYARPLVFGTYNEHWRIRVDPTRDYDYPAQLALEGWILLLLGVRLAQGRVKKKLAGKTYLNTRRIHQAALALACLGPITQFAEFQFSLPIVIAGFARLAHGLGYLGIGLLVKEVTEGGSSIGTRIWLAMTTLTLLALQLSTGFISSVITTTAVVVLSYWAVRRKLHFKLLLATVAIAFGALILKSTTDAFRRMSWTVAEMSDAQRISVFGTVLSHRVATQGVGTAVQMGWKSSARRSANMDLLADIVRRTPSPVPYWKGRTYVSLIGLAVPRFLWPSKPTKTLGQDFGHRYSLLDAHDSSTSFNLPFLVEFYVNFGEIGIIAGMFIVGIIYGVLIRYLNNPGQTALSTIAGIVLMLPLLNIESDFSLIFGGLFMDGIALMFVLKWIQGFDRNPRRTKPAAATARPLDAAALERLPAG